MSKIVRKLSRIGLYREEIFNVLKLLLLLSYYIIVQPIILIVAYNYIFFPHDIPLTFKHVLVVSLVYNILAEKIRIRFNR